MREPGDRYAGASSRMIRAVESTEQGRYTSLDTPSYTRVLVSIASGALETYAGSLSIQSKDEGRKYGEAFFPQLTSSPEPSILYPGLGRWLRTGYSGLLTVSSLL